MASQYKVLSRLETASSPSQAVVGRGGIRMVSLIGGSGTTRLVIRDENPAVVGSPTSTPIAEVQCVANSYSELHFDNADGRLPFTTGLHLTLTGTGGISYVYGS